MSTFWETFLYAFASLTGAYLLIEISKALLRKISTARRRRQRREGMEEIIDEHSFAIRRLERKSDRHTRRRIRNSNDIEAINDMIGGDEGIHERLTDLEWKLDVLLDIMLINNQNEKKETESISTVEAK